MFPCVPSPGDAGDLGDTVEAWLVAAQPPNTSPSLQNSADLLFSFTPKSVVILCVFTEERHSINTEKRLAQPARGAGAGAVMVAGGLHPQEAP